MENAEAKMPHVVFISRGTEEPLLDSLFPLRTNDD